MQVLSTTQVPAELPSPTLTNPDMILPYTSSSDSSSSALRRPQKLPSPPSNGELLARSASVDYKRRTKPTGHGLSQFRDGHLARPTEPARTRSNSESGDGRIKFENSRLSYRPRGDMPIASSPTLRDYYNGSDQNRTSEDTERDYAPENNTYSTPAILEEDDNDPYSHAAMTKRAEQILANAKKRLTNMEGNLNRARSTLNTRPSSSMSSFAERNPEPVSLYTIPKDRRNASGFTPSKHRQANLALDETRQGHSRVFSETSVPSSLHTGLPNGQAKGDHPQASGSPDSADMDIATRERHSEPSRNWFWNGLTRNTSLANRHNNALQSLNEDGPAPESFEQEAIQEEEDGTGEKEAQKHRSDEQVMAALTFDAQNPPANGLTRARSTTQMRDLRDQMQDLKGKISTLKQRARQDSLYRRSLQNLRTPSPFTAADEWYNGVPLAEDTLRKRVAGLGIEYLAAPSQLSKEQERVSQKRETSPPPVEAYDTQPEADRDSGVGLQEEATQQDEPGARLPAAEKTAEPNVVPEANREGREKHQRPDDDPIVLEEPDRVEELEDSLYGDQDYHETLASPVGDRHEDRADAFDYEHFFLLSSMGTYAGTSRSRSSSQSSITSVETTKPADAVDGAVTKNVAEESDQAKNSHGRQNSIESISTVATFATATEGRDMDDEGEERWTSQYTMAGAWQPEVTIKKDINGSRQKTPQPATAPTAHESRRERLGRGIGKDDAFGSNGSATAVNDSTPPTDLFSFLALLDPGEERASAKTVHIGIKDRELAERVVRSLGKVCQQLHSLGSDGSKYDARVCRRKLDAARRVLDGEVNGEAF